MLRRSPFNLNRQAEEATIGLIREALARGVNLKEVSALGGWTVGEADREGHDRSM